MEELIVVHSVIFGDALRADSYVTETPMQYSLTKIHSLGKISVKEINDGQSFSLLVNRFRQSEGLLPVEN